jgi:hypothetical protein
LGLVGGALALALIGGPAAYLAIGPISNNIRAAIVQSQIADLKLPAGTKVVGADTWVGNTGNGNHVEILAGVIIRTDLPEAELETALRQAESEADVPEQLPWPRLYPLPFGLSSTGQSPYWHGWIFPELSEDGGASLTDGSPDNWFVSTAVYPAATQRDMRAH